MIDRIIFVVVFLIVAISFVYRDYAVGRRDVYLLRAGLVLTLAADFCMLIIYNDVLGLLFFISVQTIYLHRYVSQRQGLFSRLGYIAVPVCLGVFALLTFTPLELEIRLGIIYACVLSAGTLAAFICRKSYPYPNRVFIPLGMLLFMLCDINVAIFALFSNHVAGSFAWYLIWVFYLPSQVLLSLSGARFRGELRT